LTYVVPKCLYFCPFSHSIKPNSKSIFSLLSR
jgi:hypothetical protein